MAAAATTKANAPVQGEIFRVVPASECESLRKCKPPPLLGTFNALEDATLVASDGSKADKRGDLVNLYINGTPVSLVAVNPNGPDCTKVIRGLPVSSGDTGHREPPHHAPDFLKEIPYKPCSVAELADALDNIPETPSERKRPPPSRPAIPREERIDYCILADVSSGPITSASAPVDLGSLFNQLNTYLLADGRCPNYGQLDSLDNDTLVIKRKDALFHKFNPFICFGVHTSKLPESFGCISQPDEHHPSHCFVIPTTTTGPFTVSRSADRSYVVEVEGIIECGWYVHCIRLIGMAQPREFERQPDPLFKFAAAVFDRFGVFSQSIDLSVAAADLLQFLQSREYHLDADSDRFQVLSAATALCDKSGDIHLASALERLRLSWEPKRAVVAFADFGLSTLAQHLQEKPAPMRTVFVECEISRDLLPFKVDLEKLVIVAAAGSLLLKAVDVPESLVPSVTALLADPLDGRPILERVASVLKPDQDASQLCIFAAHEALSNTKTITGSLVPSIQPSLQTKSFVSVFQPSCIRHFTFWHAVAVVVNKYLDFTQAEVMGTNARLKFMDFDNVSEAVSLPQVFGRGEGAVDWAVKFFETYGSDLERLGITIDKDDLSVRGVDETRTFILFSWCEHQETHARVVDLIQRLFHDSPNHGGFHLRCLVTYTA
eukprot:m.260728 g.260728  ORF g.260728 m.260728 type:complete len:663 (+) comp23910_c0_seq1:36-2024(+)